MRLRQIESHKVNVGEYTFYIKPFPAFKASNITGDLASVLSPMIGLIAHRTYSSTNRFKE